MDNSKSVSLVDTENAFRVDDENLVIKRTQDLGSHFLSNLASQRIESANSRMGDFHHVAAIPTSVVEQWMAEGFNIFDKNVELKDVLKRLQSLDMEGLMATSRRII
jgi:hypothetical protein